MMRFLLIIGLAFLSFGSVKAQDFTVNSYPYTNSSTTCGAGDDCDLQGQEEQDYEVIVTVPGNYAFSTCNSAFNTHIYLTNSQCLGAINGGVIDDDNNSCPNPNGASSTMTVTLGVGTYWLTVEGRQNNSCGAYILDISGPPAFDCANANPIECGETINTTTVGSTGTPEDSGCLIGDNGTWFTFIGTGGDMTIASTANFDHEMAISSGTCGALSNIDCDDQSTGNETYTISGTTLSETYYVYIANWSSGSTTTGTVNVTLTCAAIPTCNAAVIASSTIVDNCNPDGTGTFSVDIVVTDAGDSGSVFDDGITTYPVVAGTVTVGPYDSGTSVTIELTALDTDCSSTVGTYQYTCPPPGGACANATTIACGQTINTTSVGSTGTQEDSGCSIGVNGVWFTFTGTGGDMTISSSSSFDHEMAISSGTCGALSNIDCDDQSTGNETYTISGTTLSETYYVYIANWSSGSTTTGTVNVTLTCADQPNDDCAGASSIVCGQTISGNTAGPGASSDVTLLTCSGVSDGAGSGLWYVFTGTGEEVTASLCGSSFYPRLRVYDGTCAIPSCIGGSNDLNDCAVGDPPTEVTFTSAFGATYYILVDGAGAGDVGSFTLSISCYTILPPGDICSAAPIITCNNTYVGTTVGFTSDTAPSCDTDDGIGGGVWYQFNGNGDFITASLCGSSFDTKIRVYEGPCASLTCVTGNDDYGGCTQTSNSSVNFQSLSGTTYYILVHGSGASEGQYSLSLNCAPDAYTKGDCSGATGICSTPPFDLAPADAGNYIDLNSTNQGCLGGENKTSWYYIRTRSGGELPGGNCTLTFTLVVGDADYDFAVWGAYSSLSNACQGIATGDDPARCSYSYLTGNTGLAGPDDGTEATEGAGGDKWVDGILAEGEEIYIVCIDNWSQNTTGFALTIPPTVSSCLDCVVLPIELWSFDGYALEGKNILEWTTATEINNNYFTIERSPDSFNFHPIGTLSGAGNSSSPLNYSMVDDDPLPGTNYYRLKQTDYDGTSETFHTITIDTNDPIQNFTLFPNPGSDIITVISSTGDIERETTVTISDARGFVVEQFMLTAQNMRFDVSRLPVGMHMVTMTNERISETLTFIKQ